MIKYTFVRWINEGGICDVWRMRRDTDGKEFAGKFLKTQFASLKEVRQRFEREAELYRQLHQPRSHPNVVQMVTCNLEVERPFIILELMGDSLAARMGLGLSDEEKFRAIRDAAQGLALLHQNGIIHRDVKPSNILYDGRMYYKVSDLGMADVRGRSLNLTFGTVGTTAYMAPEQARPPYDVTPLSDIFGLGATLHHLYFGEQHRYNEKENLVYMSAKTGKIDSRFKGLLQKTLHQDPRYRFQSISEFLVQWENLYAAGALRVAQPTPAVSKNENGEAALAGLFVGLLIVVGIAVLAK